jgi:YidC/Oxa1 family membrane protein insertase
MDENTRNYIMAIVLSLAVLVIWQIYFSPPKKEQQPAPEQTQQAPGTPAPDAAQAPKPDTAPGAPPEAQAPASAPVALPAAPGASREAVLKASRRIAIDTPRLKGSLALKGGRIDDLVLKDYRVSVDPGSANVILFSPSGSRDAYYAEHGWVGDGTAKIALPTADTVWTMQSSGPLKPGSPVTLQWDNGAGLIFKRIVSVDEEYMFTVRQEVENKTGSAVTLYPYALISRHGTPKVRSFYILHEGLIGVAGDDGLQEIDYDEAVEDGPFNFKNKIGGWLGITDKYWAATVIPNQKARYRSGFSATLQNNRQRYQADYLLNAVTFQPGGSASVDGLLFAGAKQVTVIDSYVQKYGIEKFDLLIDWGWFYFLTKPMFFAIDYFYHLVGNFGIAILIVTVLIKLALFPLANKSYASMSKMKKLQPEMNRIKERYAEDKTRQQQALMDMYKKEKVNPASGCLPILVQIPVFFSLYKVLFVTIEMRHAPFYGWIRDLSAPDPTTVFNLFGVIPWDPPQFLMIGAWPLLMGVTMLVQMRLNPAPPDPMQAKIFAWMPVFFTFLMASFPAGLVIYWTWNNLLSILQQAYIMHRHGVEIALWDNLGVAKLLGKKNEGKKGTQAKGKG